MMTLAARTLLAGGGLFLLTGLLSGAWKYACIARSPEAQAPFYVDTAHRASLLYAFACTLLALFSAQSAWSDSVNLAAALVLLAYFAVAVLGYLVHGFLQDTDNQLRSPHRLGTRVIPGSWMRAFMVSLIVGEIGAFLVLFSGYLARVC
ncbi:MAG: hypothetical protein MUF64_27400 [Polyangiaceae bacterium]|jgi:hypothetical protein|nr:hypothetical protein [Polyangiaceae bacterium]